MRFGSPRPAGLVLAGLLGAIAPSAVEADTHGALVEPARYATLLSVGAPLRITRRVELDQGVVAPFYGDVLVGYVLSSARGVRHGVGLGLSTNFSSDGGFTEPVDPGEQLVVMPSYLLYGLLSEDWLALGHVGIPILAAGGRSAGLEIGTGVGYRWLAGAGFYAESSLNGFAGAGSTVHLGASLELGVFIDYEVLP